ncbi:piggyBac transposable element-derived protein 3-like [Anthonomus grandis grandis]|uniref:piggyBac transposable element-derived protein 3-like n=1 Tax=Anthonomus grandis grandis TaxID=2921223 RepID=UPI0021662CAD|nr:piggyBac transposable element-derived protein 3-like [Anthonomus grandis grandis]
MSDRDMKKEARGFSEEVVSEDGVVVVKWLDNRTVCLVSNCVGKGLEDQAKRWDKTNSQYVQISRPEVVKKYNHSMGGVDLLDQLISLYRILIRSKKWTLRVTMHMIDFALVNSWLEYKKDCQPCNVPKKKIMDLLDFRMTIAESLIKMGQKVPSDKRGRPSSSFSATSPASPHPVKRKVETRPLVEVQFDRVDHMPQFDDKKEATRCKVAECKGRSHVFCEKCRVHLCINKNRNCFLTFHRSSK